jgi:hypothetical protein
MSQDFKPGSLIIALAGGMMNSVALDPAPVAQSQHKPRRLSVTHKQALGLSLVLLAATLALYFPVIHHPFTNIDDRDMFTRTCMCRMA